MSVETDALIDRIAQARKPPARWYDDRSNLYVVADAMLDAGCTAKDIVRMIEKPDAYSEEFKHTQSQEHDPRRCLLCE